MISRSIINKGAKPSISDIQETFLECVSDSLACVLRLSGENTDLGLKRGSDEFEDEFDGSFALGPGGVGLMMETMNKVYDFIVSDMLLHDDSSVKELTELFEAADQVSGTLMKCVKHVRMKHPRHLWDPKGFRNLGVQIDSQQHFLRVSESTASCQMCR